MFHMRLHHTPGPMGIWICPICFPRVSSTHDMRGHAARPFTYQERYDHDVAVALDLDPGYVPPYGRPE